MAPDAVVIAIASTPTRRLSNITIAADYPQTSFCGPVFGTLSTGMWKDEWMTFSGKERSVAAGSGKTGMARVAQKLGRGTVENDAEEVSRLHGFGPMTRVSTSFGELPAQTLRLRDQLRTREGVFRPIQWIDRIVLDADFLRRHPTAQPVVIRAGSLGHRLPTADVILAPDQRLSVQQRINGGELKCASDAIGRHNVVRRTEQMVTYTLFHCGGPTSVLSEGMWLDVGQ